MDPTEQKLEVWRHAKAVKDYATADKIRQELRDEGVDPDRRHSLRNGDERIEKWKQAKAEKDWATADALRAELRDDGIDPDPSGPRGVTMLMQRWSEAKAAKDFKTADSLRAQLRQQGVEPDPRGGTSVEDKWARWEQAKEQKNWALADSLRDELRNMGQDPDPRHGGGGAPRMQSRPMQSMPRHAAPAFKSRPYDASIEAELDEWSEAKSRRDFATADGIRERLREQGVDPQKERAQTPSVEDLMRMWAAAKQARDFQRADRLRETLRNQGVDPDGRHQSSYGKAPSAPKGKGSSPYSVPRRGGSAEQMLEQWQMLKQQKNWAAADALRSQLREMGIDPDQRRR
jgi:cysteinyl-tRNA synthetase